MKKVFVYGFIAALVVVAGGVIWWQINRKAIIRTQLEKAVSNGTDSTYYLHYDSSRIDELNGNARFFNVVLQSDSLQRELYQEDTSAYPQTIFNVRIGEVAISGANIPGILTGNRVEAAGITLIKPVVTLINTGKDAPVKFTAADTLALYEKITGKFKSISAGEIRVVDGRIAFARGIRSPHTILQGVNITLNNFKVDSTRNYDNIISYFIRDVKATVDNATLRDGKRVLLFNNVEYNAPGRFLTVKEFFQKNESTGKDRIVIRNAAVKGISTTAFIRDRVLRADTLTTDGGTVSVITNKRSGGGNEELMVENDFFDEALVKNIRIGSTDLMLYSSTPNAEPLTVKNVKFNASGLDSIADGANLMRLIGNSNWDLSTDGLSLHTKDKVYRVDIGPVVLDNFRKTAFIKFARVVPLLTQDQFVKSLKFQKDLYDLQFNNVQLRGADIRKIITDQSVVAEEASLQAILKIFNDRTVTPDTANKIGQYPQQMLQTMKTKVYIKTIRATNSSVLYKERGALSKKTGDVNFLGVTGTIRNFTNIPAYLKKNSVMTMSASCNFLGFAPITSEWTLPLTSPNGSFAITGTVGGFDAVKLNPVIEPLGMATVKSGKIKSYTLDLRGDDLRSTGTCVMLYNDLKIRLLKNTGDSNNLKKKTALSLLANVFIKDANPAGGTTRKGNMAFTRVTTKTFFNLVWKSIFAGAKSSTR